MSPATLGAPAALSTPWTAEAAWLFGLCFLLARVEIEIEGPRGWAEDLPTWRWGPPRLLRLTNGKPITGYHLYLTMFLILAFHLPLAWGGWSPELEAAALSRYLLLTCAWDFQWFLWNPAWGPTRFFTRRVWWFPVRLLGLPAEYYAAVAGSALLQELLWPRGLRRWTLIASALAAASAGCAVMRLLLEHDNVPCEVP